MGFLQCLFSHMQLVCIIKMVFNVIVYTHWLKKTELADACRRFIRFYTSFLFSVLFSFSFSFFLNRQNRLKIKNKEKKELLAIELLRGCILLFVFFFCGQTSGIYVCISLRILGNNCTHANTSCDNENILLIKGCEEEIIIVYFWHF